MIRSNFHTHTTFCDGKNTPREMVEAAIALGFDRFGFSGHSPYTVGPYGDDLLFMVPEVFEKYKAEVLSLKEEYRDRIKIYFGIEQDIISPRYERQQFDYVIGSVHTVELGGKHYAIDGSAESTKMLMDKFFGGDYDAMAENYFSLVKTIPAVTGADIIGHFDLITKYNELFGVSQSERFLKAAEDAVKALVPYGKPFEINTGAISRGYRTTPYPSPQILAMIKKYGGSIAIGSDCHSKDGINCAFDMAETYAKKAGFNEYAVIGEGGIEYIKF